MGDGGARSEPGAPFAQSGRPPSGRAARTFKPRRGRMSPADRDALADLVPGLLVEPRPEILDQLTVFGRVAPLIVEIGFGSGETVRENARRAPECNILAVDIHTPGFATLARALAEQNSTNVRIVDADAIDVLTWMIAPASVRMITTYFPDPWRKAGHRHRRLIQDDVAALVADRLEPTGEWRIATDWADYARDIVTIVDRQPRLANSFASGEGTGFAPREAERPITKFEGRAIRAGRQVFTVIAQRQID